MCLCVYHLAPGGFAHTHAHTYMYVCVRLFGTCVCGYKHTHGRTHARAHFFKCSVYFWWIFVSSNHIRYFWGFLLLSKMLAFLTGSFSRLLAFSTAAYLQSRQGPKM